MARRRIRRKAVNRPDARKVSGRSKTGSTRREGESGGQGGQIRHGDLARGSHLTPAQLLQLQSSHGNSYVMRFIGRLDGRPSGSAAAVASSDLVSSDLVQTKKKPAADIVSELNHPKTHFLNTIIAQFYALRGSLDAPSEPLKTKKQRNRWRWKTWRRLKDTSLYRRYKESKTNIEQWFVKFIGSARVYVNRLKATELKVSEDVLKKVKGYYHRRLNGLAPYFTQMANMNILWKGSKTKNEAWRRTCNMTSLGMSLQSLGLQPADFKGDKAMLLQIAQHFDPAFKSFADLEKLRMPDFLQFVAIYFQMPKVTAKDFGKRVDKARAKAAPLLSTTLTIFEDVAGLFDVERAHTGYIASTGSLKKNDPDASVGIRRYKRNVKQQLEPWLDQGGQVVVNKPGHYVRLEEIDDIGIVIDDPASKGKNFRMSWRQANKDGYFRSYMVFLKK